MASFTYAPEALQSLLLQNWTTKFFGDAVVEKWLDDVIAGAELVYTLNDIKVSVRFQFQSTTD